MGGGVGIAYLGTTILQYWRYIGNILVLYDITDFLAVQYRIANLIRQ
jgi:hypothetical protein